MCDSLLLVETHCTGVGEQGAARERVGGVLVAHATLEPLAELVRLDEGHRHALAYLLLLLVIFQIFVRRGIDGAHGQGGEFERVQVSGVPIFDSVPVFPAVGLLLDRAEEGPVEVQDGLPLGVHGHHEQPVGWP